MFHDLNTFDLVIFDHNFYFHRSAKSGSGAIVSAVFAGLIFVFRHLRDLSTSGCCRRPACAARCRWSTGILLSGQCIFHGIYNASGTIGRTGYHIHIRLLPGKDLINHALRSSKESRIFSFGTHDIDFCDRLVFYYDRNFNRSAKSLTFPGISSVFQIKVSFCRFLFAFCFCGFLCFGRLLSFFFCALCCFFLECDFFCFGFVSGRRISR